MSIEPRPQPFGSDALLSEPLRHVLLGISLIVYFLHHFNLVLTKFSWNQ